MAGSADKPISSPNFAFLVAHDPLLVRCGALAEKFVFDDANTALIKLGQLAELLAKKAAAYAGIIADEEDFAKVLRSLNDRGLFSHKVGQEFLDYHRRTHDLDQQS